MELFAVVLLFSMVHCQVNEYDLYTEDPNNMEQFVSKETNRRSTEDETARFKRDFSDSKLYSTTTKAPKGDIFVRIKDFILSRFNQTERHRTPPVQERKGWKSASWGYIPKLAFVAGATLTKRKIYIARAKDGADIIVGTLIDGSYCVRYASKHWPGRCNKEYQVLIGDSYMWLSDYTEGKTRYMSMHPDVVPAGYLKTVSGVNRIFICRAWYDNRLYIGRVSGFTQSMSPCIIYAYGDRQFVYNYETLIDSVPPLTQ